MKKFLLSILSIVALSIITNNANAQVSIDINADHFHVGGWHDTIVEASGYEVEIFQSKIKDGSVKVAGITQGDGPGYLQWTITTDIGKMYNNCLNRRVKLFINDTFVDTIGVDTFLIVNHTLVNANGDVVKLVMDHDKQGQWTVDATNELEWTTEIDGGTEPTAIAQNAVQTMAVYPNPASKSIALQGNDYIEASVFSITGALIKEVSVFNNTVQVNDLIYGAYLIKAKAANGESYIARFIKE